MLQAPFLCDYPGAIHDEPRGQSALGSGALHCHYRATDGWMAPKGDLPTILESLDSWLQRDERRLLYFDMGDSCVAFAVRADQAAPAIALGKKLKLVLHYAGEA
jgi:hypothetical protein